MSQADTDITGRRATDLRAAEAVVRHHAELATTLTGHVAGLVEAAEIGSTRRTWQHRDELVTWLHAELLPHAAAEEGTLYPAAATDPAGRLLVDGMVAEHHALTALVAELTGATTPIAAALAARALSALFQVHLAKENDLVLPLLLGTGTDSLADLLDGMHSLLGGDESPAGGRDGNCGGGCGCGGDTDRPDATATVLTIDARLDVRDLPHHQRHARVFTALDGLSPDRALVLIAPHAPRPLLAEIDARYGGDIDIEWLEDGPDVWQIRLHRQPATV